MKIPTVALFGTSEIERRYFFSAPEKIGTKKHNSNLRIFHATKNRGNLEIARKYLKKYKVWNRKIEKWYRYCNNENPSAIFVSIYQLERPDKRFKWEIARKLNSMFKK